MINSIIEAISLAIHEEFNEKEYETYMEEVDQELEEPCFFISCINPTTKLFLGKRYFCKNMFCIQYFPESEEANRECNEVAERLMKCLEYITVNGRLFRGTQMEGEVENEEKLLNFFVNYDCFLYKVEPQTSMEALESKSYVKGGG